MGPIFLTSAGAKFTIILLIGKSKPEFFKALLTLSRDSFTEASGRPTISKLGRPIDISDSTVTKNASIPIRPILKTEETIKSPPYITISISKTKR